MDKFGKRDATTLRLLLDLAEERDIAASTILSNTDLTKADIDNPYSEIEVWQEIAAIRNLISKDDDPTLGVISGMRQHITSYGALGIAMMSSRNLKEALSIAGKFHAISLWMCDVATVAQDDLVTFTILNHRIPTDCRHYLATRGMAALAIWINELLDNSTEPKKSTFKNSPPQDLEQFSNCFGSTMEFDTNCYSISFDRSLFGQPLKLADRWARMRSESELENILSRRLPTFSNKVKNILLKYPQTIPTETEVSNEIGSSMSTLRRRLREENTSFRKIKGEIMHELACRMLLSSSMTVDQIAGALGYSESASFGRAFKRRAGTSPGEWRRKQNSPNRTL